MEDRQLPAFALLVVAHCGCALSAWTFFAHSALAFEFVCQLLLLKLRRYRTLEPAAGWIVRPQLEPHGEKMAGCRFSGLCLRLWRRA